MSVSDWGTGRPDYSAVSFPARTEVESTAQTAWHYTFDDLAVPANYTLSATLYTVSENQKLVLGYIKATTNIDGIGYGAILKSGTVLCPIYFSQYSVVPLPDTTGFVFNAGDTLGFEGINNLNACVLVSGDFSGFLYKV